MREDGYITITSVVLLTIIIIAVSSLFSPIYTNRNILNTHLDSVKDYYLTEAAFERIGATLLHDITFSSSKDYPDISRSVVLTEVERNVEIIEHSGSDFTFDVNNKTTLEISASEEAVVTIYLDEEPILSDIGEYWEIEVEEGIYELHATSDVNISYKKFINRKLLLEVNNSSRELFVEPDSIEWR